MRFKAIHKCNKSIYIYFLSLKMNTLVLVGQQDINVFRVTQLSNKLIKKKNLNLKVVKK